MPEIDSGAIFEPGTCDQATTGGGTCGGDRAEILVELTERLFRHNYDGITIESEYWRGQREPTYLLTMSPVYQFRITPDEYSALRERMA